MNPQPNGGKYLKAGRLKADKTRTEVGDYLFQHNFERHRHAGGRNKLIDLVEDFEDGYPWPSNYDFAEFARLCHAYLSPKGGDAISQLMLLGLAWQLDRESAGFFDVVQRSFQGPRLGPTT